mmetsp:Transcript_2739/g.10486  ORF Transcript_2739/g.10486 Transcript_2739/m.10486 type:complete len:218 (-) Transcript_2739:728-1381(-)
MSYVEVWSSSSHVSYGKLPWPAGKTGDKSLSNVRRVFLLAVSLPTLSFFFPNRPSSCENVDGATCDSRAYPSINNLASWPHSPHRFKVTPTRAQNSVTRCHFFFLVTDGFCLREKYSEWCSSIMSSSSSLTSTSTATHAIPRCVRATISRHETELPTWCISGHAKERWSTKRWCVTTTAPSCATSTMTDKSSSLPFNSASPGEPSIEPSAFSSSSFR